MNLKPLHSGQDKLDVLNYFLTHSPVNSVKCYRNAISDFEGWLFAHSTKKSIFEAEIMDINSYLDYLQNKYIEKNGKLTKYRNRTINAKKKHLSSVFSKAVVLGIIPKNPVIKLGKLRKTNLHTSNNIVIDFKKSDILSVARKCKPRLQMIILTLAHHGLRIGDLIHARHADVTLSGDIAYLRLKRKGGKDQPIYLSRIEYERICRVFGTDTEYLFVTQSGKQYISQNLYRQIRNKFLRYVGKPINPHKLRHWWGDTYRERGMSIKEAADYMGNSVSVFTEFYVHSRPRVEKVIDNDFVYFREES